MSAVDHERGEATITMLRRSLATLEQLLQTERKIAERGTVTKRLESDIARVEAEIGTARKRIARLERRIQARRGTPN